MEKSEGKTEVIFCRVSAAMKKRLEQEANGEADAVIVRKALNEYFDRRDHPENYPPYSPGQHYQYNERPDRLPPAPQPTPPPSQTPRGPVDYKSNSKTAPDIRGNEARRIHKRRGDNPPEK